MKKGTTSISGLYKSGNSISKIYRGDQLITTFEAPIPTKGQLITMTLGNATPMEGTQDTYRVLSVEGNIAFVMAMFDVNTVMFRNSNENTYAGGNLDTYLNETWYNSLSTTAKSAIVATNITQYTYGYSSDAYNEFTHASDAKYSTKAIKAVVGNRYVYALDIEDIETYFNGIFSKYDLLGFFWLYSLRYAQYPWLRSAYSYESYKAWYIYYNEKKTDYGDVKGLKAARPAFRIDLSKISWS